MYMYAKTTLMYCDTGLGATPPSANSEEKKSHRRDNVEQDG